ncbi:hypothetical protein CH76_01815 [Lysinibacillus sp. BF-4]|uniref:helix-turn-helix transcriptional regulator n=1 Tax=Lysinibacillus sp. BF-4 TaxID=1473546 RepID=UPI0005046F4D|nr:helix-turn-helix transcriptional regulator [Lysinibacillus sp. BF-4]KFL44568.1 hypothetical protein CH76_01815 [Lysinibacillus sp. BF-4]
MTLVKLKKIREDSGMTYQKVAEIVGISKEHYWFIENGKRGLTYDMAVRIANVFNKKPDEIFFKQKVNL